jgi:hypothetical protein
MAILRMTAQVRILNSGTNFCQHFVGRVATLVVYYHHEIVSSLLRSQEWQGFLGQMMSS